MPERYLDHHLGRFRIDSLVGTGGFAWVYKGYDPELDIPVAIKVLKPQFSGEAEFETRFRQEASVAARLRHPNIIRILAVGREEDASHFVMDYLPGGLPGRLAAAGQLPEPTLVRMGIDVADALAFAHREGVIHRDIKTDNILFDDHGNAVVADFGIARAATNYVAQTGTNMVVGTPQYFSPEQARGHALDGRSDIYSLGVTLFEAATGRVPFQAEDWYEIARQHIEDEPPRPRSLNETLSEEAERIILKSLAKDPEDRYPTAEELRVDLARLLSRTVTPAELPAAAVDAARRGSADITQPMPARRRVRRTTMVLAAVALLAAAGFALDRLRPWETPPPPAPIGPLMMPVLPAVTVTAPTLLPSESAAGAVSRELRVRAPTGAEVILDGARVGAGTWQSDSITPGTHVVAVSVRSVSGCPSARLESKVEVAAEGMTSINLTPRPCGYLAMDVLPATAKFVVLASGGTHLSEGATAKHPPIMLPTGRYRLKISAPFCADFSTALSISAGATRRQRVRLICR